MTKQRNTTLRITAAILTTSVGLLTIVAIGFARSGPTPTSQVSADWTLTSNLNTERYNHTATVLNNGKILAVGGRTGLITNCQGTVTASAELYNPSTETWTITGSLNQARSGHTASLLPNGQVLVVGGFTNQEPVNTAELYDPTTGIWRNTRSLNTMRATEAATLLANGKVLVIGFADGNLISAELYDSAIGTWSSTGAPSFVPTSGRTVLLPNGKVLAVEEGSPWGYGEISAELYDPASGQWSVAGQINLFWSITVTPLRNGKVLVTGLYGANYPTQAALYDTNTSRWSNTGSLGSFRHYGGYAATLLSDGKVLVTGGVDYPQGRPGMVDELYDPTTGTWNPGSRLINGRLSHTATLLQNGKVLVAGGVNGISCNDAFILRSAELYNTGIASNPADDPQFFVRQQYLDFFNREPDAAGLAFWMNEIISCGTDTQCIEVKRVNVSAAFFLSIEFQESGYFVYRMYKAAYGDMPSAPVPLTRQEFLPDSRRVGDGVVVGASGWEQQLLNNKNAFADDFVARGRFTTTFPHGTAPDQFVETLNANTGGALSEAERNQLISDLHSGAKTHAQVLLAVAEDTDLKNTQFNRAFVLMQYFGYLQRNPNDTPDRNFNGYNFWLAKLNQFNGNFLNAEMVKAFIASIEYRNRFDACLGC